MSSVQRQRRRVTFPERQSGSLPDLWRETLRMADQFGDAALGTLIEDVEVSSAGTEIAHGLRRTPRAVFIACRDDNAGVPYRYQAPDAKNVYLRAVKTQILQTIRGRLGAGAVTAGRLIVGDVLEECEGLYPLGFVGSGMGQYETTISVAGQIQQTAVGDFSGAHFLLHLRRHATVTCDLLVVP